MEDKVFGYLEFNIGWNKVEYVEALKKEINIRVDCYQDENPNNLQKECYKNFLINQQKEITAISEKITDYLKTSKCNFDAKEILFLDDGRYILIFTTDEHTHSLGALVDENGILVATEDILDTKI